MGGLIALLKGSFSVIKEQKNLSMVEPFLLIFESFLRILVKFRKKLNDAGFPRLAGFQGLKN